MSVIVLFFGRVALWSSLDSTPQSEAVVSMAFFLAAVLAGGCSQMIGRKGTFYLLQKNYPLVRWTVSRFIVYSGSLAALVIALVYTFYVVPYYGLHLGELFAEFAAAIFIFLLSAAPLYMLRRFYTLALATGLALVVTLATARLFTTNYPRIPPHPAARHRRRCRVPWWSSPPATWPCDPRPAGRRTTPIAVVKPPELRVVLWHTAPYAVYGMAYFVMILVGPIIVGFAYGHSLGVDQYVYPSTFEGSVDLALLELVVLLGLVYASIERFGRRLRPLLEGQTLDCWRQARDHAPPRVGRRPSPC